MAGRHSALLLCTDSTGKELVYQKVFGLVIKECPAFLLCQTILADEESRAISINKTTVSLFTFLSYIKNARYMLTDSFHGTAFAINFHTPFLEVLPNNKTGARNQSILQLTGLEDRIVTDFNDFSLADRQIDYAKVNEIMHRERERSMEKLAELCECQM